MFIAKRPKMFVADVLALALN